MIFGYSHFAYFFLFAAALFILNQQQSLLHQTPLAMDYLVIGKVHQF